MRVVKEVIEMREASIWKEYVEWTWGRGMQR